MSLPAKAVIFDFNGTLFHDSEFHHEAWCRFANRYGKTLNEEDFDAHIHGSTNREIIEYLFQTKPNENEMLRFYEEKETIYREICKRNPEKCILTPGADVFLDYLSERNIPCTIATASYQLNVEMYFHLFHLNRWFQFEKIVFDTGGYRGKPYPDMFLASADKLGIPIDQCMIIEDSIRGVKAAVNAGAGTIIAVDFDRNPDKFSLLKGIDSIISDFRQLITQ